MYTSPFFTARTPKEKKACLDSVFWRSKVKDQHLVMGWTSSGKGPGSAQSIIWQETEMKLCVSSLEQTDQELICLPLPLECWGWRPMPHLYLHFDQRRQATLDTHCGWAGGSVSAGRWESPAPFCMQELLLAHFCLRNIFLGARESCPLRDLYWWLWIPTSASTREVPRFTVRYQKYQGLSWLSQWMMPSMRVFTRKPFPHL